jgi:hypothetical protein
MKNSLLSLALVFAMGSALAQGQITVGDCLVGSIKETQADGSMIVEWTSICPVDPAKEPDVALSKYTVAASADIATTAIGLRAGDFVEGNPLGIGGVLALKVAGYVILKNMPPSPKRTQWANQAAAIQWGFAANNICLLAGAAMPICQIIGLSVGAYLWPSEKPQTPVVEFLETHNDR